MRKIKILIICILLLSLWLPLAPVKAADGEFLYEENIDGITLTKYTGGERDELTIPSEINGKPVTRIGVTAFNGANIGELTIPKSVTGIEEKAFSDSTIGKIQFEADSQLNEIFSRTFNGANIGELTVPKSVTAIEFYAFSDSIIGKLQFEADSGLIQIFSYTFNTAKIDELTIPKSVTTIDSYAFSDSTIRKLQFEVDSQLSEMNVHSFEFAKIDELTIPKNVTSIGYNAFRGTTIGKMQFEADSQLDKINSLAFESANIDELTIPKMVTSIEDGAFLGATIEKLQFEANSQLTVIGENAFLEAQLNEIVFAGSMDNNFSKAFSNFKNKDLYKIYDGISKWDGTINEPKILFVKLIKPEYTIQLNDGATTKSITVINEGLILQEHNPKRVGYKFLGWYLDEELTKSYNLNQIVESDFTLYAKWVLTKQLVTFDTKEGSSISPVEVDYDTKLSKPTDPTKSGYTFVGWYTDEATQNAYDFDAVVTKPFTLYAKWTQNSSGGGIISPPAKPTTPAPSIKPPTDDEKKLTGTTVPNAIITIKINEAVYTIQADNHGFYTFDYSILQAGQRIEITATAPNGVVSSTVVAYVKDKTPPALKHTVVSDKSTKVTITSEPHTRIYLYENNRMIDADFTDEKGRYTAPIEKMRAGTLVKLEVVDRAGNRTVKTWTVLDRTAPTKPKMTIKKGVLSGKTEKNATITIKKGSKVIKTIKTKDGKFSMKLSKGTYSMTFTDAAKNKSKVYKLTVS